MYRTISYKNFLCDVAKVGIKDFFKPRDCDLQSLPAKLKPISEEIIPMKVNSFNSRYGRRFEEGLYLGVKMCDGRFYIACKFDEPKIWFMEYLRESC